jgi:hypothetical protein
LLKRYSEQRDAYLAPAYNETQVRRELLDPFFSALGWDVANRQGYAEAYKDVIHEDQVRVEGSTKAPDYSFRVGGNRKFFVEAKKPSVDVEHDPAPALQLRRYGWSAGLPLSVLMNFEHLAVYDTRIRPHQDDRASTARVLLIPHAEYADRWQEIENLLSREAVLRGEFDRFAESSKLKRGTARFDDAFLADIEEWRKLLASAIARDNRTISEREANLAVQSTLDRIVFLRIAEDRGIERYGRLRAASEKPGIYERLTGMFRDADARYNSGLFHFRQESSREPPDETTLALTIDDKPLRRILHGLYYPESPYEFSVVPLDVLGRVYERFLGKQVRVDARGARVEEKPLVRKAGGVFYTPGPVVDFIVSRTLGAALHGKKPGPRGGASQVRVLDPACGSGSFLIAAYEYLLTWHRDRYVADGPEKHRRALYRGPDGGWALAIEEKKRILTNGIFGVDIDEQAVEVTKLSLLLKVLEGESAQTVEQQLRLFHERALPDLSANIRCGNSLVSTDWFGGATATLDPTTSFTVNPFDWRAEFRDVFDSRGGFDVIIGNPPYVSLQSGFISPELLAYLEAHYACYERITDYFALFLERVRTLATKGGHCGLIVPATVMANLSFTKLRTALLTEATLSHLAHLGDGVFRDAVVPTCILVWRNAKPKAHAEVEVVTEVRNLAAEDFEKTAIEQARFLALPNAALNVNASEATESLLAKVAEDSVTLGSLLNVKEGVKTGDDATFLSDEPKGRRSRAVLKGRDIEHFEILPTQRFIDYDPARLSRPQTPEHFEVPEKLLIRRVGNRLVAALDSKQHYCVHTLYTARMLPEEKEYGLPFLLAVLNSRLLGCIYRRKNPPKGKVFPEVRIWALNELPVPQLSTPERRKSAAVIKALAERAMALAPRARTATGHERAVAARELGAVREQIDQEVYRLYGLSAKQVTEVERFYP